MKRLKVAAVEASKVAAADKVWSKHYPALVSFLTDREYDAADGGGKRELGMFSLWANDGSFHLKLRDNDSGHVCFVSGTTFEELLQAADACCSDPAAGWRPEVTQGKSSKRKGS